jgi:hypothetical protein
MAAVEIYCSPLAELHPAGWLKISTGYITKMPVWEGAASGLLCHRGAAQAAATLAPWGMRLPTWQEYLELYKASLYIDPVTLPNAAMLQAAGISLSNQAAIDAFRNANMSSRAWCEIHDKAVFAALAKAGWDGKRAVANAGKHWCNDGAIYGWWLKSGGMIQNLSYFHEPGQKPNIPPLGNQCDYASDFHAWAPAPGGGGSSPLVPAAAGGSSGGSLYPVGAATGAQMRTRKLLVGGAVAVIAGGALAYLI